MASLSSKKVAELREELQELGLPTDGTKPVLVKRLQAEYDKKDKKDGTGDKKKRKTDDDDDDDDDEEEEAKPPAKKPRKEPAARKEPPAKKGKGKKKEEEVEKKEEKVEKKEEKEEKKEEEKKDKEEEKEAEKKTEDKKPAKGKGKGKAKAKSDDEEEEEASGEKKKEEKETKEAAQEANKEAPAGADGWKWKGTLMYWESPDIKPSEKLACFDYDGCLANTSLFKKGPDAWSLLFDSIPAKMKELHDKGYKLVIMTNQADIGKAAKPETRAKAIAEKVGRLTGFVKKINLPFQILVATANTKVADDYRKPAVGMWDFAAANNGGVTADKAKSFFVGDAAGRPKDHHDTDKVFAKKAGLKFFTEDVFFKNNAAYE